VLVGDIGGSVADILRARHLLEVPPKARWQSELLARRLVADESRLAISTLESMTG
jgi:hypothetical protein